ncbi:hypothetical protein OK348_10035 [Flavobacterium sp. MXW15]|uniref:Uncharacterized protein n=1 Tax=Xanthomonas chitinilytica TaxID=2989819 RepID=A0ABT3JW31_9XANT|nr:hypothetical protein [Xanthomonas sp. H13-6]MCW4455139.1 hypothetical protein [Flavobacterium sp. MXW15]MCW4472695.1 hypothetical protein [Xanthomonas sp. H13-6]
MSGFQTRRYDVFLFLAAPDAPPLWRWESWQRLAPALEPLMQSPRGRTSLRMTQFHVDDRGGDSVRFGQLGWNTASHRKWTHGSPRTLGASDAWDFHCAGVWSPGPTVCEREDNPPDTYLTITNEIRAGIARDGCRFAYSLLLARACDLPHEGMDAALALCRELTRAVLAVKIRTAWSPAFSGTSMSDWDAFGAPYRVGNHHASPDPLSAGILEGDWTGF